MLFFLWAFCRLEWVGLVKAIQLSSGHNTVWTECPPLRCPREGLGTSSKWFMALLEACVTSASHNAERVHSEVLDAAGRGQLEVWVGRAGHIE